MFLRIAKGEDAPSMLDIYSPFILNTGITQETELPSVEDFRARVLNTLEVRPWLVCDEGNAIAGYAYAGKHRERKGYQWCIEPSVYVNPKFFRRGVAHALYTALFGILKYQGYMNAYAVITLPNESSVQFHESFGFKYLTTYKKIGYKLGQWHDVGWWEKSINEHVLQPADPVKFPFLGSSEVLGALKEGGLFLGSGK